MDGHGKGRGVAERAAFIEVVRSEKLKTSRGVAE
jgi:hypothetical protein